MNCRHCGKEVAEQAVMCVSCGCLPKNGKKFCNNCGVDTNPLAEICVKCGVRLATEATGQSNAGMSTGEAVVWFLLCYIVGFVKLGQGLKALIWFGIIIVTGGFAWIPAGIDFFMCNAKAQKTGKLGEMEWFPKS